MSSSQEKLKISKTCNEFDVSKYTFPNTYGNTLSDETKLEVLGIFESDEFSRMCPGKKEKGLCVYNN